MKSAKSKPEATATETTNAEASTSETMNTTALMIRIVKSASCPSLSGKSTLQYNVGCTPDAAIYFRVSENSGTGFFSREWIPLSAIEKALAKADNEKELTSFLLYPLFAGRSQNSPGFLFAAIKAEGVVSASTKKRRCYERADESVFLAEVQAWMASGSGPKVETKATKSGAKGKGKAVKAIGDVPPTAPTKDVPAKKGEVPVPLPVMADILPRTGVEKPGAQAGKSKAAPKKPAKGKAK